MSQIKIECQADETCYFIEDEIVVTQQDGEPVRMGDLVIFPMGLACHWEIPSEVEKYYNFD